MKIVSNLKRLEASIALDNERADPNHPEHKQWSKSEGSFKLKLNGKIFEIPDAYKFFYVHARSKSIVLATTQPKWDEKDRMYYGTGFGLEIGKVEESSWIIKNIGPALATHLTQNFDVLKFLEDAVKKTIGRIQYDPEIEVVELADEWKNTNTVIIGGRKVEVPKAFAQVYIGSNGQVSFRHNSVGEVLFGTYYIVKNRKYQNIFAYFTLEDGLDLDQKLIDQIAQKQNENVTVRDLVFRQNPRFNTDPIIIGKTKIPNFGLEYLDLNYRNELTAKYRDIASGRIKRYPSEIPVAQLKMYGLVRNMPRDGYDIAKRGNDFGADMLIWMKQQTKEMLVREEEMKKPIWD